LKLQGGPNCCGEKTSLWDHMDDSSMSDPRTQLLLKWISPQREVQSEEERIQKGRIVPGGVRQLRRCSVWVGWMGTMGRRDGGESG
jgi:hypothetical protein